MSYFVTNLHQYEEHRYFQQHDQSALAHLGFFIGMYHGGILSPQTGALRSDATTLAILDHHEAKRGYRAGRKGYFHEPDAGYRYSEEEFIEALESLVLNNPYTRKDNALTWYHTLGCLLGELSGQVFSENAKGAGSLGSGMSLLGGTGSAGGSQSQRAPLRLARGIGRRASSHTIVRGGSWRGTA